MATKKAAPKWTTAQKAAHIQQIKKLTAKLKTENKLENFTAITEEQILEKFKRINSPMIVGQGWSGAIPGGTVNYSVTVYNPDPTASGSLIVHVFVGSGNPDTNTGTFLLNVDSRFPTLTQTAPLGFSLAPGASTTLNFALAVPTGISKTGYLGNSCLMQVSYHDTGKYLDRGCFIFAVT
jgi:hypothetical protein